jgi:hypothetical protein
MSTKQQTAQAAGTERKRHKAERKAAYAALRKNHGFSEYALQEAAKDLRTGWLARHIEAVVAQTLATRAYRALQRVALGRARQVRFKSRGRGLSSIENKRNDTGLRFAFVDQAELLEPPACSDPDSVPRSCGPGAQKRGRKVHEILAMGNTIIIEKVSYKAWQKQYGKSVSDRAPGMFVAKLRRTGAAHGRHPARSLHANH